MPEEVKKEAPKASDDTNLFAALCYIIGILVPLFVLFTEKKENKTLAFHAWQSLIFSIVAIIGLMIISVGLFIVSMMLGAVTYGIGGFLNCLWFPIVGVVILFVLFVAYKAYQGEKYMMPVIGEFAQKQVK